MCHVQYLEDLDYSLSAQFDRFDGFDRGDVGADQEYLPTAEEEAEMLRLAAEYVDTFVGPVQPVDMWTDLPF